MNSELQIALEKMTIAEKMDIVDRIMDDLSRNSSSVPEIGWHGNILKQRAENLENGNDRFISLDEAEARIREKTGR